VDVGYKLKRNETIVEAVPRIAREQVDGAVAALRDDTRDPHERVHEARTAIKKLRGLLRLVEPGLGARFAVENARLRDIAATLSRLRDAEVLVKTFDDIWDHFDDRLSPSLRRVRTKLCTRLRSVESRVDLPARLVEVDEALTATRRRARHWRPGGTADLRKGLSGTYQRGRRAMKAAYRKGSDEHFHDWRKAVKHHGYHCRLLSGAWPAIIGARLTAVEILGELLGLDHDLGVFAETLDREPDCLEKGADRKLLLGLVERRQQELRAQAQPLGRRLYADPPGDLTRQLLRWHSIFCAETKADMRALLEIEAASAGAAAAGV